MFDSVTVIGARPAAPARPSAPACASAASRCVEQDGRADRPLRPRPRDRRGGAANRARARGSPRQRRDAARRARPARAALLGASAADARHVARRPSSSTAPARPSPRRPGRGARARPGSRGRSGCEPFDLADDGARPLPRGRDVRERLPRHAAPRGGGAARGSPARRPRRSLPLMRRTIENGFELTGPIVARRLVDGRRAPRGDPGARSPSSSRCYRALAEATCRVRTVQDDRARCAPRSPRSGRRAASGSCRRWARSTRATTRCSPPPAPSATRSSSASS